MKTKLPPERQDLICWLFAEATSRLEMAHRIASQGQAPTLTTAEYVSYAVRLKATGQEVETLASAAAVLVNPTGNAGRPATGAPDE